MKKLPKYILIFGAVFIALLMISSATAVPYTTQEPFRSKNNSLNERLKEFRDNSFLKKFEILFKQRNDPEKMDLIRDKIQSLLLKLSKEEYDTENEELATNIEQRLLDLLSDKNDDPERDKLLLDIEKRLSVMEDIDIEKDDRSDYIHVFLIIIVDIILLLFGQNIIGKTITLLMTLIIAIPYSLIASVLYAIAVIVITPLLIVLINVFFNENFLDDLFCEFFHLYGIIFGSIILVAGTIIILLCIPLIYIIFVAGIYVDGILEVLDYLFTITTSLSEEGIEIKSFFQDMLDEFRTSNAVGE